VVVPAVYRPDFIPRGPLGIHGPGVRKSGGAKREGPRDFISPALLWIAYYIRNIDWYVGFGRRKLKLWARAHD
jgi:hypothetical protein